MKRVGYIYENIYDIDNIYLAMEEASKGKTDRRHVRKYINNKEYYAPKIQRMLINREFKPNKPRKKTIQDTSSGKIREIFQPNFYPDQIIHWALLLQVEPIISRGMYEYNVGCIPNRGNSYGKRTIRRWLDKDTQHTKYCLKMDIKKYFPSIDNEILKQQFRRKIKDLKCLELIDSIIDSNEGQPIGYYTSQWFSNFYLEGLDHYIKQELKVKYYLRYVDDLIIFGNNKRKLHKVKEKITEYCGELKLEIKDNYQVFPIEHRALDFLGYRFFREKTILRSRNSLRIRRRARKIRNKGYLNYKDASAMASYWGWIIQSDSYLFYHKYIAPNVSIQQIKKVVSENGKIRNNNRKWGVPRKQESTIRLQKIKV